MTHLTRPNCPGSPWITIKGLQWASLRTLHSTEVGGETVLWVQELFKAQKGKWVGISYLQIKYHRNTHTSAPKDMYENVPSTTRVMVNEQNLIGCPWTVKEVRKWKCGPTEILYSNEKSTQQQWGRTSPIRKWVKKARKREKEIYALWLHLYKDQRQAKPWCWKWGQRLRGSLLLSFSIPLWTFKVRVSVGYLSCIYYFNVKEKIVFT